MCLGKLERDLTGLSTYSTKFRDYSASLRDYSTKLGGYSSSLKDDSARFGDDSARLRDYLPIKISEFFKNSEISILSLGSETAQPNLPAQISEFSKRAFEK